MWDSELFKKIMPLLILFALVLAIISIFLLILPKVEYVDADCLKVIGERECKLLVYEPSLGNSLSPSGTHSFKCCQEPINNTNRQLYQRYRFCMDYIFLEEDISSCTKTNYYNIKLNW